MSAYSLCRKELDLNILIVGASGGIGRVLTEHFDRSRNFIYGTYNFNPQKLYEPCRAIFDGFEVDFTKPRQVQSFFSKIPFQHLDAIINCLGVTRNRLIVKMQDEDWDDVINSNLKSVFLSCKHALPHLKDEGHIINISSVLGQMGMPGASNYSAAKGAVEAFTRSFSQECLLKRKIFVNAISLGYFKIGMGLDLAPDIAEAMKQKIPLKDFGEPSEIALAVDYVLASKYLSGSTLQVNGGLWNS